jgi:glycosyltransferase involved in cell wall biosynthesis
MGARQNHSEETGTPSLLVLVPVFNEGPHVKAVLAGIRQHTAADILVVNDGSTDNSLARIGESDVTYIINHEKNVGPGGALISGFRFATECRYQVLITMDADGQHEARDIPRFLEAIEDVDIVLGSRYLPDSERRNAPPKHREWASGVLTRLVCQYTAYNITDCACGFRAYRISALRKLNLTEKGYAWPFQLWIQADGAGLRVKEIPIALIYFQSGEGSQAESRLVRKTVNYCRWVMQREMRSGEPNPLRRGWGLLKERFFLQISNLFLTLF